MFSELKRQFPQERVDEPGTVAVQEVDQRQRAFLRLAEWEYLRLRPRELTAQGVIAALGRLDHLAPE